jgi:hypothetical protein
LRVPAPQPGQTRQELLERIEGLLEPLGTFAYAPEGAAATEVEAEAADAAFNSLRTLQKALRRPVEAPETVPDPQGV